MAEGPMSTPRRPCPRSRGAPMMRCGNVAWAMHEFIAIGYDARLVPECSTLAHQSEYRAVARHVVGACGTIERPVIADRQPCVDGANGCGRGEIVEYSLGPGAAARCRRRKRIYRAASRLTTGIGATAGGRTIKHVVATWPSANDHTHRSAPIVGRTPETVY